MKRGLLLAVSALALAAAAPAIAQHAAGEDDPKPSTRPRRPVSSAPT